MNILEYEKIKKQGQEVYDNLQAEYKQVNISMLGGRERVCLIIKVSLDKKENWENCIFHNSRYYIIGIYHNGEVENFSKGLGLTKIRKKTVKSLSDAINYINEKINKGVQNEKN